MDVGRRLGDLLHACLLSDLHAFLNGSGDDVVWVVGWARAIFSVKLVCCVLEIRRWEILSFLTRPCASRLVLESPFVPSGKLCLFWEQWWRATQLI